MRPEAELVRGPDYMPAVKPWAKRVKMEVVDDDDAESMLDGSLFHYTTDEDARSLTSAASRQTRSSTRRSPSQVKVEQTETDPDLSEGAKTPRRSSAKGSGPRSTTPPSPAPAPAPAPDTATQGTDPAAASPRAAAPAPDTRHNDPMATLLDEEHVYQIRLLPDLMITLVLQGIILR